VLLGRTQTWWPTALGDRGVHDGRDPGRVGEQLLGDLHRVLADVVDGRGVAAGRQCADAVGETLSVDDRFRAQRAQEVVVAFARRADDPCALCDGDLHGEGAHTAGGGVHQDRVAACDADARQRLEGRETGEGETGGLLPVQGGRLGRQRADRGRDELGERAVLHLVLAHIAADLVPHGELGRVQADRLDDTRHVPAGNQREVDIHDRIEISADDLPVDGIHAGGLHPDEDGVGRDPGIGRLGELQNLRPP
jgi:hypothetical protein